MAGKRGGHTRAGVSGLAGVSQQQFGDAREAGDFRGGAELDGFGGHAEYDARGLVLRERIVAALAQRQQTVANMDFRVPGANDFIGAEK